MEPATKECKGFIIIIVRQRLAQKEAGSKGQCIHTMRVYADSVKEIFKLLNYRATRFATFARWFAGLNQDELVKRTCGKMLIRFLPHKYLPLENLAPKVHMGKFSYWNKPGWCLYQKTRVKAGTAMKHRVTISLTSCIIFLQQIRITKMELW